ncbi:glycoside hydrolase family 19 protein [Pantoea sp. YU22]|uniref:glycoside hydrolase family 19 protein n=1 Tax=Pantoea sp. YU22 TaxID=2497684 RepID=UPI000F88BF49|nr:glycoside hydrolase family 19 protein [Pantoea sp. YU22]RTY53659.1 glycoside hydrolase family 19 protein [Pantoea sp. YU22]
MNVETFARATGISTELAARWVPHINAALAEFEITDRLDVAMFIAQAGHESSGFSRLEENFNYSLTGLTGTFGSRFSPYQSSMLCRQAGEKVVPLERQKAIANIAYGGRYGNTIRGDGWTYRGRGLKQITFKDNYKACGNALGVDLVANPDLLLQDEYAARSAAWFFKSHGCCGLKGDVKRATEIINGGDNGLSNRVMLFKRARMGL